MKETMNTETLISIVKVRGWQDAMRTALDVLEPVAPLVSQLLLVLQPMSNIVGARDVVGELADIFDNPQGIEHLRQELDDL